VSWYDQITLFTGQWADLPFEEVCRLASEWGYDGLEIACWGDHFEVDRALSDDSYVDRKRQTLAKYNLNVWAISNHLVGQAVCDHPIDQRHQGILPPRIWATDRRRGSASGPPRKMQDTARCGARLGVNTVIGFTGSSIWHTLPCSAGATGDDRGRYEDFARRWNPILDVYDEVGVRSPTRCIERERIRLLDHEADARGDRAPTRVRPELGPVHSCGRTWTGELILDFADRIYHVDAKDAKVVTGDGRRVGSPPTCRGPICGVGGTSSPPATGTYRGRTASGLSTPSIRRPISVEWRTPAWTVSSCARGVQFVRKLAFDAPAAAFERRLLTVLTAPGAKGVHSAVRPFARVGG